MHSLCQVLKQFPCEPSSCLPVVFAAIKTVKTHYERKIFILWLMDHWELSIPLHALILIAYVVFLLKLLERDCYGPYWILKTISLEDSDVDDVQY